MNPPSGDAFLQMLRNCIDEVRREAGTRDLEARLRAVEAEFGRTGGAGPALDVLLREVQEALGRWVLARQTGGGFRMRSLMAVGDGVRATHELLNEIHNRLVRVPQAPSPPADKPPQAPATPPEKPKDAR